MFNCHFSSNKRFIHGFTGSDRETQTHEKWTVSYTYKTEGRIKLTSNTVDLKQNPRDGWKYDYHEPNDSV